MDPKRPERGPPNPVGVKKDQRFDTNDWAEANFGNNDFRDVRHTKRCVSIGQAMATHPEMFISGLSSESADVVAAYRFLHNPLTDYKSETKTHTKKTRSRISEKANEARQAGLPKPYILLLGDSSDTIFGYDRHIDNAGPIGENNARQGFVGSSEMLVRNLVYSQYY